MKRYVRNKFIVLSLAGGLVAVGVGSILGEVPSKVAGIKSTSDLMSLLKGRSPGDRAAGASASKTKRPLIQAARAAEKDSPVLAMAVPPAAVAAAPLLAPAAAIPAAAAVVPAAAAATGSGFFLPPFLVPLGGGGGGGITVTTPPTTPPGVNPPPPPPPPPPPGPAVPEPDTWLMLTIGFGALGGVLRRRRKVLAKQGARSAVPA